jgi:chitinase
MEPGAYNGGPGWEQRFDNETKSPYAWNNGTGEFISYDDPVSVSYKREWARQQGMLGLMIWQVPFDRDGGELLDYMN